MRRQLVIGLSVPIAALLAASVLLPMVNRARYSGGRTPNGDRMHQVGLAILLYTQDHHGAYPPDLATLLQAEGLGPDMAFCTDDGETDPPPAYVYLGRVLTLDTADAITPVAYTPLAWAGGRGSDVLFGDGHLDWIEAARLPAVLARGGPVTRPATPPAVVQSGHG